ncbi:M20/M25/M40 family metallo-hydrolase [Hymenobacter jejuensis]|uniref:M20/M25/M40 family metallo-hydrolase n=1 Tax=Hymenobacter jejuensis TaxID=2502781 RepID=A0A5B7ZV04_9BACT|nr:M20/M25/M40 family metallo-hydrolase [Hymenobacter jejuensis]QDA58667.1 M20/M25/M40 family metallo-hydrolase [Hymenobacter jejuensis]
MQKSLFIILLTCFGFTSVAQNLAPKPAKLPAGVSAATVERVVRALTADDMQGRASTQPGGLKAAQFLSAEFKRIGLQPITGLAGFEQTFSVYETKPQTLAVTLNGAAVPAENAAIASGQAQVNWSEADATPARVVIVGAQEANPMQTVRPLLALRENTLVLVDPAHRARFQQLAAYLRQGSVRPEQPGPNSCVVVLAPAPADGKVTFQVKATATVRPVELRNVVGVLPGRSKDKAQAAEMVVFSGHYDHLGTIRPVAGDSIANGADDDASGTTAVVALAEYFKKKKKNARTLVFVAFAAEEIGGFGSQYFSKQVDPAKVAAMFNIEMIGKVAKFGPNTAFITGYERSDFGKLLQQNLQGTPFRFEPDPYPEQNLFYRSDNATLARLGVPAHTISTDQIPTDKLYHSVDDEVESLDLANMTAVITAIARSATGIVAGQQTPQRIAPESVGQRP